MEINTMRLDNFTDGECIEQDILRKKKKGKILSAQISSRERGSFTGGMKMH